MLLLAFQYVIAMAYTPEGGDVGQHCNDGNRNSQPHYVGHNATYNGTEGGEHNGRCINPTLHSMSKPSARART